MKLIQTVFIQDDTKSFPNNNFDKLLISHANFTTAYTSFSGDKYFNQTSLQKQQLQNICRINNSHWVSLLNIKV